VAQVINYSTQHMIIGWRLSLGLAGVPALLLIVGCIMVPETPNSLVERGHLQQAKITLAKIRGTEGAHAGGATSARCAAACGGAASAKELPDDGTADATPSCALPLQRTFTLPDMKSVPLSKTHTKHPPILSVQPPRDRP
jgi:hypothetical protein